MILSQYVALLNTYLSSVLIIRFGPKRPIAILTFLDIYSFNHHSHWALDIVKSDSILGIHGIHSFKHLRMEM